MAHPIPPQVLAALAMRQVALGGVGMPMMIPMGAVAQQQQVQVWQGQFPPPEAIERYEKTLPGTFNRMVTMAEQLQAAQIEDSRRAMELARKDTKRGHYLGFFVAIAAIASALGCVALGQPWVAALLVSVPVMAVAQALVASSRSETPSQVIQAAANLPVPTPPPAASPVPSGNDSAAGI